jgi:hypothetical protein
MSFLDWHQSSQEWPNHCHILKCPKSPAPNHVQTCIIEPTPAHWVSRPATIGFVMVKSLVRVVGLEPTLLAETDFESVASTIPPHPQPLPPWQGSHTRPGTMVSIVARSRALKPGTALSFNFCRPAARFPQPCYRSCAENVSHDEIWPDCIPVMNQRDRCSEVPWVKVWGIGVRPALRCKVSSPI